MKDKSQKITNYGQYHPDFDELLSLAKDNPAMFESKRLEYIELFFSKVPEEKQRRLRGLQWQIDQTRNLARTPMASCIYIMNMMRDSLNRLNEQHQNFAYSAIKSRHSKSITHLNSAPDNSGDGKIIPFPGH